MSAYMNMPVCDLRHISSAEEAQKIESIMNVAILILAKDADEGVKRALTAVPKKNIASTLHLEKDAVIHTINGVVEAQNIKMTDRDVLLLNGVAVFGKEASGLQGSIVGNGVFVFHESLKGAVFNLLNVNGRIAYLDFDSCKLHPKDMEIDAEYLSYLSPRTAVIAGKDLKIGPDVDVQQLKEKEVLFAAGKDIVCPKALYSYVAAHGYAGQEIVRE